MRASVVLGAPALACTIAWVVLGCGCGSATDRDGDEGLAPTPTPAPARDAATPSWATNASDLDVHRVLATLDRSHAAVRDRVGPHRIEWDADYALEPTTPADAGNPPVDAPVVQHQRVVDALRLTWLPPDASGPRFQLSQHNDHDRGRELVVIAGRLYTRLEHRPFMVLPLEGDVHELWLDDAVHGARDALAFVAPALTITAAVDPGSGLAGGDAIVVGLGLGEGTDRSTPGDRGAWRKDVAFEAISGELRLDAVTGQWLALDLDVRYALQVGASQGSASAAGGPRSASTGPLRGSLVFHGRVQPLGPKDARIVAPPQAAPLPARTRLEVERDRILDGLAAP